MFSFHKPKIYRSHLGCCICKAKSSSSRFTDSKKYENEFQQCFRIDEQRSGEICNACVLLVKRWKKLSPESRLTKHWHHVVDARAGPGTGGKLSGPKRITISSSNHNSNSNNSNSNNNKSQNRKYDVLPLSLSSQTNSGGGSNTNANNNNNSMPSTNTSNAHRTRISNKARAIDTNVSHFTFGEPNYYRRNYMMSESSASSTQAHCYSTLGAQGSSFAKPQSALNSSAFESVIKRFRQRQQQEQLDAKRRESMRQSRQRSQQQRSEPLDKSSTRLDKSTTDESSDGGASSSASTSSEQRQLGSQEQATTVLHASKQVKRAPYDDSTPNSSMSSSLSPNISNAEILRISSLLDGSIWRKEKICCGHIFRGPCNEVAIFPKLLKPCQCRLGLQTATMSLSQRLTNEEGIEEEDDDDDDDDDDEEVAEDDVDDVDEEDDEMETEIDEELLTKIKRGRQQVQQPPPRATKSGSISSCDSNTSGTGSMEQPLDDIQSIKRAVSLTTSSQLQDKMASPINQSSIKVIKPGRRRQQQQQKEQQQQQQNKRQQRQRTHMNVDQDTSSSSSSSLSPSSRLMLIEAAEADCFEEAGEMILEAEDLCESSNDATGSSVESLAADKDSGQAVKT